MSIYDEFFEDEEPVSISPVEPTLKGMEASIARILANAKDVPEPTYRCGVCCDRLWLVREKGGAWPCAKCVGGKSVLVTLWLDICFPIEPRFNKRIGSARGQDRFDEYVRAWPEQEGWLREGINARRREEQASKNRQQEMGRSWT